MNRLAVTGLAVQKKNRKMSVFYYFDSTEKGMIYIESGAKRMRKVKPYVRS
ncbi:hypothetical protein GCM10020370_31530 [Paenibacillus hodogayensis]